MLTLQLLPKPLAASRRDRRRACATTSLSLALLLLAAACTSLSYPSVEPDPEPETVADVTPVPTRDARVWTELARAGRDELRSGNLQAAESRFRAALAATAELPAYDARARAALVNLLHLGELYQQQRLYEDAARITSVVVDESGAGRGPDFDAAARLLLRQALHFEQTERAADAAPLYACALGLAGAGPQAGAEYFSLRLGAARLQLGEGRFDSAAVALSQLLAELDPPALETRLTTRLALAVAETGRGEMARAEAELRLAREEAQAAGPAATELLRVRLADFAGWLRESGLEDEARALESLAARP